MFIPVHLVYPEWLDKPQKSPYGFTMLYAILKPGSVGYTFTHTQPL